MPSSKFSVKPSLDPRGIVLPDTQTSRRRRLGRFGLRVRILMTFGLGSLALSAFLAVSTSNLTRSSVVEDRESSALNAASPNAKQVSKWIQNGVDNARNEMTTNALRLSGLVVGDQWTGVTQQFADNPAPPELIDEVLNSNLPQYMRVEVGDSLYLAMGFPLDFQTNGSPQRAVYLELALLDDVRSTLSSISNILVLATAVTTLLGVLLGIVAASRAVRPLTAASRAAQAIAGGRLETRMETTDDPDLEMITTSFNEMARALQTRIERDNRFTSDVSHELRSPLMTMTTSVEVMQARRAEMPERAQAALDLLVADVHRFQVLVEDLLEISRFDAGAIRLEFEEFGVAEFVRQAIAISSAPTTRLSVAAEAEELIIRGDRRRLARVVANLIDNGMAYGGGDLDITVRSSESSSGSPRVRITVEEHGPGVAPDERELIFERFARGASAGRRSGSEGAGLGLSLVVEHVKLHQGKVWVEDRHDGDKGACFVIELPAVKV
jgi:two-component system, OmpR family, sensor histidine kinase MtrB